MQEKKGWHSTQKHGHAGSRGHSSVSSTWRFIQKWIVCVCVRVSQPLRACNRSAWGKRAPKGTDCFFSSPLGEKPAALFLGRHRRKVNFARFGRRAEAQKNLAEQQQGENDSGVGEQVLKSTHTNRDQCFDFYLRFELIWIWAAAA